MKKTVALLWEMLAIGKQNIKLSCVREVPTLKKNQNWKPKIGQSSEHEALINSLESQKGIEPQDKLSRIYMQDCI